jgi:uncharacterized protein
MNEPTQATGQPVVDWRALRIFLLLTFALSWIPFLLVAFMHGSGAEPGPGWIVIAGAGVAFGPAGAAIIMRQLVTREGYADAGLRWRVRPRYFVLAFILPFGWNSFGIFLKVATGASYVESLPSLLHLVGFLVSLAITSLLLFGEEFGWRAYCLEKLRPLGCLRASAVTGFSWGIWHVPFVTMPSFLIAGELGPPLLAASGQILFVTLLGLVIGWLYWTSGSVWPAILMHATANTWGSFLDTYLGGPGLNYAQATWLWCLPLIIVVAALLATGRFRKPATGLAAASQANLETGADSLTAATRSLPR